MVKSHFHEWAVLNTNWGPTGLRAVVQGANTGPGNKNKNSLNRRSNPKLDDELYFCFREHVHEHHHQGQITFASEI